MNRFEGIEQIKANHSQEISLQQSAFVRGMLDENKNATTNFKFENGSRVHQNELHINDYDRLVEKFGNDPKKCLAFARENLLAISADTRLDEGIRNDRVKRYLEEYFDLVLKLDRSAFPPSDDIRQGVPEYIPDGFVDMGSDYRMDAKWRSREKILVDKKIIFKQSVALFRDIFSRDLTKIDSSKMKNYFILRIAKFVHQQMPYNYENMVNMHEHFDANGNLPLSAAFEKDLSVCRHHALYAQVLMQSFGLTSRLMKCNVRFGNNYSMTAHAANLVRNNFNWYLLDATNSDDEELRNDGTDPVGADRRYEVFLKKLPEKDIDINEKNYRWQFERNNGEVFTYQTRNNMHYYIEDVNKK